MPRLVLDGMFVPSVTPFTRMGRLDVKALRSCVRFWLEGGVSGLAPCGSNGEAPYLSRQERMKVIETVLDEVNGKVPVIAGTGSMSTQETVTFTKDAADIGVDAALVVTPFYFKLSNREIHEHFRTVSEAVDVPIVVYNVPKFTGVSLEPPQIQELAAENERIIGIKDSSGNMGAITETVRLTGDKISVLAGTADVALSTLLTGGRGAVLAVGNVFPALCSHLYEAFKNRRYEEASRLQNRISFANEVLVKRFNQIAAIKEAMRLQGLAGGYPRKPALSLDREGRKTLENLLKEMNPPA
ncbi:MAG: 4-hydroxy-tetrahydrodipicolinate synthase [Candidatus Bathyarchaeia archaeon]|jgi:4-hydroxy-tetrahydrodipicolinate synthase